MDDPSLYQGMKSILDFWLIFFIFDKLNLICIDVAMRDLVHDVETVLSALLTANSILKSCLKYE